MAFPAMFLDELVQRNPIDEVVGQYVSLTRKGANLFGLCPFHGEKTASFSVAPDKGIYYYTTYDNHQITAVDMHREDLDGCDLARYPLIKEEQINFQN